MLEAQKRLQQLQKQEKERLKVKDNRDRYLQFMRGPRENKRGNSRERNICALDLNVQARSKIPKPSVEKQVPMDCRGNVENVASKIPKLPKADDFSDNLPWKKGDLLDSLDLGSTNMKKLFKNRPKLCESPGGDSKDNKGEWLKENFRESINEWAPKKLEPLPQIKPTRRILNPRYKVIEKNEDSKEADTKLQEIPQNSNKPVKVHKVRFRKNPESHLHLDAPINIAENAELIIEKAQENVLGNKRYQDPELKSEENAKDSATVEPQSPEFNQKKALPVPNFVSNLDQKSKEILKKPAGAKKSSKFVNKSRSIPEPSEDLDFLENELQCVEEEEEKLKASLARLDIKSIRAKNQAHLAELSELESQAKALEESLKKNTEIIPNKHSEVPQKTSKEVIKRDKSPTCSEISTHPPTSHIPDNASVFSAHPYPRGRQLPDARSACSEFPDNKYGYANKNERKCWKKEEECREGKKETHRIGAVYNEISARSGRYNQDNPPPEYALPKNNSKEMISFRKQVPGPEYTLDVVKINPNVDINNWYQDLPKWD